ncbi:MAG TPA: sensor histidine kinase, partial [Cellulomonadaceae bacterium]|nr:sensor histidine kinase [Cellulomonadaceae bacterium]
MRRRILQATIAAVTVAVILLGFPLAFFGAQFVRENDLQELDARAQTVASIVDFRLEQGISPRNSWLDPYVT